MTQEKLRYHDKNKKTVCYIKLENKHMKNISVHNNKLFDNRQPFDQSSLCSIFHFINKHIELNEKSKFSHKNTKEKLTNKSVHKLKKFKLKESQWKKFPTIFSD